MAIIYPLDVPLEEFSTASISRSDTASIQVSTFTGRERVQEFEGDWWNVTLNYQNLNNALGRQVRAFGAALRGPIGTFVVRYPGYDRPLGEAGNSQASPLVDGAGQAGSRELKIKSAAPDVTGWLLPGDIIQVGPDTRPHWHEVLTPTDTNAGGFATIQVWPAIRNGASDNDPIILEFPKCLFRLTGSFSEDIRPPTLYTISFNARESTG